jgi:hypothetical protein
MARQLRPFLGLGRSCPNVSVISYKMNAAIRESFKANPMGGSAFASMVESSQHWLARTPSTNSHTRVHHKFSVQLRAESDTRSEMNIWCFPFSVRSVKSPPL